MEEKKYTPQNNHTQEKLRVFSSYLDVYLGILLRQNYLRRVDIYDMFAGRGKYGDNPGSAVLALEIIKKHREESKKDVRLYLNDSDPDNYRLLCEITKSEKWVSCQGIDANDAINGHIKDIHDNRLGSDYKQFFYLDPFGYSQIEKETLDGIIRLSNTECLLFVPVTRIVQFFRIGSTMDGQLLSIKKFLKEYHINIEDHKDAEWHDWGHIIKDAFAKIYSKQFVGMAKLDASAGNYYALYFIGNHIFGLDKFVETVAKWESKKEHQLVLFSSDNKEIYKYLSEGIKTNKDLYVWGLRQGWTPSKTRKVLSELEGEKKITVVCHTGETRRKGTFYLGYQHYKDDKIKIEVSLVK